MTTLGFLVAAVVKTEFFDSPVFADVERPGVTRRVAADSEGYFTTTFSAEPLPSGSFCMPSSVTVALVSQ